MTRWEAVGAEVGHGRLYSVVRVNADGTHREVLARWTVLSWFDAKVIAEELNRAYEEGARDAMT